MNTQAIEQLYHWALQNKVDVENNLKEEKEKESRYFLKGVDSAFDDIIAKIKEALASLPTAQPTEVYVAVSVEDEDAQYYKLVPVLYEGVIRLAWRANDGENDVWTLDDNETIIKPTHWLKPTKAILIPE